MDRRTQDSLPIGRAAFARALCSHWVAANPKLITAACTTFVVLIFCLFKLSGGFLASGRPNYFEVHKAFSAWMLEDGQGQTAFQALEGPLRDYPELETKFGARIAQRMLALGDAKRADSYARAAIHRAGDMTSPYYERFSRNTLAISRGQFQMALDEAILLKTELEQDDRFWQERDKLIRSGTVLYAYNLMRIASLQRQLGSREGELEAWQELIRNAGWREGPSSLKTYDPEAYSLLAQNFSQGDVSLLEFIDYRCKQLR